MDIISQNIEKALVESFKNTARLVVKCDIYKLALTRIANTDYRGNRSRESQIALEALKKAEKEDVG